MPKKNNNDERVFVVYESVTDGVRKSEELAFKSLALGVYNPAQIGESLSERHAMEINNENFNKVFKEQKLALSFDVPDMLYEEEGAKLEINLKLDSYKDFSPNTIKEQVPELKERFEKIEELKTLKALLTVRPELRREMNKILKKQRSSTPANN